MKKFQEAIAEPREVALYANLTMDDCVFVREVRYCTYDEHYMPLQDGERRELPYEGYVRITQPIVVTFNPVDSNMIVRNAVESLSEQERKTVEELNTKLAQIRERKNQLLALTHQPEAS